MSRKILPIGVQSFADIRSGRHYYADKTGLIHRLVTSGKYYFLSRPRRFGKSLLVDTIAELFAGNEALFRGLAIHPHWDWSVRHPVVKLSFGGGTPKSAEALDRRVRNMLGQQQRAAGVDCADPEDVADCFQTLVRQLAARAGQRVVLLVDEYDRPIADNAGDRELAGQMRDGLRNLYTNIKELDAELAFVLLTGVSKFSKAGIFSGLNNLRDITLSGEYSALCGYTESDLDEVFRPELEGVDRDELRRWYNGYNWDGESVYNPWDVLLYFQEREYRAYWYESGTPGFLVRLLSGRRFYTPQLEDLHAAESLLSAFDPEHIGSEALLFQAGYLTLRGKRKYGARTLYRLGYPNQEVQGALNDGLLQALVGDPQLAETASFRVWDLLEAADFEGLRRHLESLYAGIPHDWYRNNPIADYEGYYASVFYSHLAALGLDIRPEDTSNQGRLDLAVLFAGRVYLMEFKVVEGDGDGSALAQLRSRDYAAKYRGRGEPIHLVGIEFDRGRRRLAGFDVADG